MKRIMYLIVALIVASGCDVGHIETDKGLECAALNFGCGVSCNWEKYNRDTNFGEYPYAKEEK